MLHHTVVDTVLQVTHCHIAMPGTMTVILQRQEYVIEQIIIGEGGRKGGRERGGGGTHVISSSENLVPEP